LGGFPAGLPGPTDPATILPVPPFLSERTRNRVLTRWAHAITARPWLTIGISVFLAVASLIYTATELDFKADRSDLINPSLPWQQRYAEFKRAFPRWDDAIVVVDRVDVPDETLNEFLAELTEAVDAEPALGSLTAGFPTEAAPPGLILSRPFEEIRETVRELMRLQPVLAAPSPAHLLQPTLLAPSLPEAEKRGLETLLVSLAAAGRGQQAHVFDQPPETQRFTTESGRFALAFVPLVPPTAQSVADDYSLVASKVATLRGVVDGLLREERFAALDAGVTGVPVIEADESTLSMRDATVASILALALIALLLIVVYRGFVVPLFALLALLIGVAWSFGWTTLAVGHLQLLSVVFAIILLGLGVDAAIHLIARLELVHPDHDHMPAAVASAFRGVGPGILTGALSTAAAFGAAALTDFAGVAEMGIIAAGGVILTTIAVLSIFPALLEVLPRPERRLRAPSGGANRTFGRGLFNFVDRRPRPTILVWLVVLAGFGFLVTKVRYDPDLLALLPESVESVRWENALEEADERSVWHAVVVAETEGEARRLAENLRALPEVASVGGAAALFPSDVAQKRALLESLPDPQMLVSGDRSASPPLQQTAASIANRFETSDPALAAAAERVAMLTEAEAARAMSVYQGDRAVLARRVEALRTAMPPEPGELPRALQQQWVGAEGRLLLRVYPEVPEGVEAASVLAPKRLTPFATAVLREAPTATGPAIQIYESTRLITRAYLQAAGLALIAIFVILVIDFRSLWDALCALAPVFAALVLLLGLLPTLGISLNFANTIVMPLILGIGVDAGVHAVHRWRQQPYGLPAGLAGGSGRAITLTALTTAIGFACMMIAEHRGVRSLGLVMTLGLALVWIGAVLLLPAILRLRTAPQPAQTVEDRVLEHLAERDDAPHERVPRPAAKTEAGA